MSDTRPQNASGPEESVYYYPSVETHVRSRCVNQIFKIQVMRPPRKRSDTRRLPVVYATDGNVVFDMFKGISWLMQGYEREWPPFILVTIGYPGDAPDSGSLLRARDFTFPGCPDYFTGHPLTQGLVTPEPGAKDFCGADDFQRFILDELIPFVDTKFETAHGDRTYFGHSMGAAFGLFTLLTKPGLFRNYIISSPALGYHGETPSGVRYENDEFLIRRVREFIASGQGLEGIALHVSVGMEEEFDPLIANWRFTSNFFRLIALLRQTPIPGLRFTFDAFSGKNHLTAWPLAFMHGIPAVLRKPTWQASKA